MPIVGILYGLEALPLKKSQLSALAFMVNRFLMKLSCELKKTGHLILAHKFGKFGLWPLDVVLLKSVNMSRSYSKKIKSGYFLKHGI